MKKLSPFLINGSPKLCWGCGQPFPIRQGHIEALVGQDGAALLLREDSGMRRSCHAACRAEKRRLTLAW